MTATTVEGNVDCNKTYINACKLLSAVGLPQVPVAAGEHRRGGRQYAAHVHGTDGLGGLANQLPPAKIPYAQAPNSVDTLITHLQKPRQNASLLAVGPLTNLSAAQQRTPGILNRAKEIVVMGGAIEQGNVTPYAEFNIHFDPEAAHTVFDTAKDVILIPLNVTRKLVFTQSHATQIVGQRTSTLASLIKQLTEFMSATAKARGAEEGFLIHDAATVAYLIHPETLTFAQAKLTVELRDMKENGETIVDFSAPSSELNTWIAMDVQADVVLDRLCEDLRFLME